MVTMLFAMAMMRTVGDAVARRGGRAEVYLHLCTPLPRAATLFSVSLFLRGASPTDEARHLAPRHRRRRRLRLSAGGQIAQARSTAFVSHRARTGRTGRPLRLLGLA